MNTLSHSSKKIPTITDLGLLKGKRVLLRLDFNVPIKGNGVRDDYRIRMSMTCINMLRAQGARVIIVSHIESEEGTLRPVYEYLKKTYQSLMWISDIVTEGKKISEQLQDGDIALAENLRMHDGEKSNDPAFAQAIAACGDVYVNDAFSVSHRRHASVVGVPALLPHAAGPQLEKEMREISQSFTPIHPFLFILGGVKFDTKIPLIQKFLDRADMIFVGGALVHNFYKEADQEIGMSVVSEGFYNTKKLMEKGTIHLPTDVVVTTGSVVATATIDARVVGKDQKIVDAGVQSLATISDLINKAQFILWNGPLGNYEAGYVEGTQQLARLIAQRTKGGAHSVVGGGDTLAAITALGIEKDFSFVSTGGGAMLDFLVNETLPGIDALA